MEAVLIFSDVHADIGALDMIIETAYSEDFSRLYGPVRTILNLGDVLERGRHPAKVIRRLRSLDNLISVRGNHDDAFLSRQEVSGSDNVSRRAHRRFRDRPNSEAFFQGMSDFYVDARLKFYAAHGGPIDPVRIPAAKKEIGLAMLYSRTWQRISEEDESYDSFSGYHYMPRDAFEAVEKIFGEPGFLIVCGHQHEEAAYVQKGNVIEDVLDSLPSRFLHLSSRIFEEKKLPLQADANYLVRVGMAGPEGYRASGFNESRFGVLSIRGSRRIMFLLNYDSGRALPT